MTSYDRYGEEPSGQHKRKQLPHPLGFDGPLPACPVPIVSGCRPLPTPCRNKTLPTDLTAELSLPTLRTALEDAEICLDETCAQAVSLLQIAHDGQVTCGRHGAAHVKDVTELMPDPTPVRISLSSCVGPVVFDLTQQQMPLGRDLDSAFAFLRPWPFELSVPPDLHLHASTRSTLASLLPSLDLQEHVLLDELQVYTDGSFNGSLSAWSVVIVGLAATEVRWLRWFSGRVCVDRQSSLWLGAECHGPQEAELTAICFAQLWVLSMCRLDQLGLLSDSLVCIQRACGQWQFPVGHTLAQTCRGLCQAIEALDIQPWRSLQHIRAHCGHHWNEFADVLAKAAVDADPLFSFHIDVGAWVRDRAIDSLWLLLAAWKEPEMWPRLQGNSFVMDGRVRLGTHPAECYFGVRTAAPTVQPAQDWRCLRFVSANVQSLEDPELGDGLHGYEGRVALVRAQMVHRRAHVVAIQEARTQRAETLLSTQYLRFCSGRTNSGQLGVELWLLREAQEDGVAFRAEEVTVTHFDPRILCLRVRSPFLHAVIACIHAPVATDASRDGWWMNLLSILKRVASDLPLVLIGDWNTRFSTTVCSRTGDLVFPSRHPVSPYTWDLMAALDIWAPSTYSECHTGPSETWFAPGGTASARLDYVGIPISWQMTEGGSFVMADVDLGQKSLDHLPICADVWLACTRDKTVRHQGLALDREAMATAEGQRRIRDICQRAPTLPWDLEASAHYYELETYFANELKSAFPLKRRNRSVSFLSDATWVLRDHRLWLRRSACGYRAKCKMPDAAAAFRALRMRRGLACARIFVVASICAGARSAVHMVRRLRDTRLELRRALRADRRAWMSTLAQQAAVQPTRDVVAKLRPLLQPRGKAMRFRRGLPAVRLECGSLARTEKEALDRWIRHFAMNEGGTRCLPADLLEVQRLEICGPARDPLSLEVGDLPSRSHLERAMARLSCGKAAGPDRMPPELLKFGAGVISRSIYPLFLKMVLRLEEAIQFKGGILHQAWKGRSSPSECASHRALLVSSTVGKILHSVLRTLCVPSMRRAASPLQVGGLPTFPVQFPAHLVRLFQSWQSPGSYAIMFLDLREAFYRVCRPMLQNEHISDEELARIFQQLSLPPDTFQSFRAAVRQGSVLDQAQTPEWLQQVLGMVLRQTWFRLPQQTDVVWTTLGSRPGDCLADVLFYFVFSAVLQELRTRAAAAGLLAKIVWCDEMFDNPLPVPLSVPTSLLPVHDVTWMDDLSLLLQFPDASSVLDGVSCISGILIDCCLSRGLMPNLDRGKTEALVSLAGTGARHVRASCLSDAHPTVPVASQRWTEARMRIVPAYKHLGGMLHHKGGLKAEVRARTAQAWQSYRKHWSRLFGQAHVHLKDKMTLFQSLVLPCLFYGSGTWTVTEGKEVQPIHRCYHDMCKSMLRRHFRGDVTKLHDDRVRALVRAPAVSSWFHFTRLSYLASFVRVGVKEAWALAHAEGKWLALVCESLSWLHSHHSDDPNLGHWHAKWEQWCELIRRRPNVWKRLLRQAMQKDLRCQLIEEGWQHCRGLLAKCLLGAGAVVQAAIDLSQPGGHFCGPCRMRFGSKQRWAVHAFKKHGIVKQSRCLASGSQCPYCLKQFPSNISLCNHLDYSVRCKSGLIRRGLHCSPQPGVGSKHADTGANFLGCSKQGFGPFAEDDGAEADAPAEGAQSEVSRQVLDLLEKTLADEHVGKTFADILEAYRVACCSVCLTGPQLCATTKAWLDRLEGAGEELPVWTSAMHRAVAAWVDANWSVDWLCGTSESTKAPALALFKQSREILMSLDFAPELDRILRPFVMTRYFLLCSERHLAALAGSSCEWKHCLTFESCIGCMEWLRAAHDTAKDPDSGHLLLCLAGLARPPDGEACSTDKGLEAAMGSATLFQDVVLVIAQLWTAEVPFVALLPGWDSSILSTLRRLPGVQWTAGSELVLLHTATEDSLPSFLFHLL